MIIGWAVFLITFMAITLGAYNWMTFLLQTAIVVSGATVLLVVYENAGLGEKPKTNWKKVVEYIVAFVTVIVGLVFGVMFVWIGLDYLIDRLPMLYGGIMLAFIVLSVGLAVLALVYRQLKDIDEGVKKE